MRAVKIFDTTLRDGEQSPGCSMNLSEKLKIARQLEDARVDIIEAGFPISSPGDFQSVREIARIIRNSTVAGLARATEEDIRTAYDALKDAASPRIHLFIATSDVHMEYKLRMSREEVLERIASMTALARSLVPDVEFSAEDASRTDRDFLAQCVRAAIDAGATTINIPDTVGYAVPEEMYDLIRYLRENVEGSDGIVYSVHCHDDLGMAVANSLSAVKAGAGQVEVAVNGIGERAGNASLEEVVMGIQTRPDWFDARTGVDSRELYRTSRLLSKIIGWSIPPNKSIVGANAFAHEAGIHQHGVLANRATYEIMTAESVGQPTNQMILGKHSGRHAFEDFLKKRGFRLTEDQLATAFAEFKDLCDRKKSVTEHDIEAIVTQGTMDTDTHFTLKSFVINSGTTISSMANVTLETPDGDEIVSVATADGPIYAAFQAVDNVVPIQLELDHYKLNALSSGEDALGEVTVKVSGNGQTRTGRGLSTDVIESSLLAYLNAVNQLLSEQ